MKIEDILNRRLLVRGGTGALYEFYIFEFSASKEYVKVGIAASDIRWMSYQDNNNTILFDKYYRMIEILPENIKKSDSEPTNKEKK